MDSSDNTHSAVHDLRGNLHAVELALLLLEQEMTPDKRAELIGRTREELRLAKINLEAVSANPQR